MKVFIVTCKLHLQKQDEIILLYNLSIFEIPEITVFNSIFVISKTLKERYYFLKQTIVIFLNDLQEKRTQPALEKSWENIPKTKQKSQNENIYSKKKQRKKRVSFHFEIFFIFLFFFPMIFTIGGR